MNRVIGCVVICMSAFLSVPSVSNAVAVSGQGTWEATLHARDLDGNLSTVEGYYDSVLDITWYQNSSGLLTWSNANSWASALSFSGASDWRLPTMIDTGSLGCNGAYVGTDCGYNVQTIDGSTVYSELATLFYLTLGNRAYFDTSGTAQAGWGLTNTGPFIDLQSGGYWYGIEYAPNLAYAWVISFANGNQGRALKGGEGYTFAVHDGDVGVAITAVPLPAAGWLLGCGLVTLAGLGRRNTFGSGNRI